MQCLKKETWKLVPRPKGKPVLKSKWVFRIKLNAEGLIEKFKSRLVVLGCMQKFGINFTETYSPVVRLNSLLTIIIAIARKEEPNYINWTSLVPSFKKKLTQKCTWNNLKDM